MNVWFAFASRFVHFVRFCSWKGQEDLGGVWLEELKVNKYCSTFVLFDKKVFNLKLIRFNRFIS
jgi:hypothetical protein